MARVRETCSIKRKKEKKRLKGINTVHKLPTVP